jgi:integrase
MTQARVRHTKERTKKGQVAILVSNGRLQLRFNFNKKRHYLSLGIPDGKAERKAAEAKAKLIESDIAYDRFDETLAKYKPQCHLSTVLENITPDLVRLWEKYCEVKKPNCAPGTWKNGYMVMTKHLNKCPEKSLQKAQFIYDWAINNLTPDTARRFVMYMEACCSWALRHKLIEQNPFTNMEPIKVKKRSNEDNDVNPFTKEERDLIIKAFFDNRYYKGYATFVRFLFCTGCRPSEAIALQWKHIGKSTILFEQSVVQSEKGLVLKKGLKTQDKREFPINQQLRELLESIKPSDCSMESLVFPSPEGKWIDIHNFRNRAWKAVLDGLEIPYRKPYQTRHTFISQQKASGVEDGQIAKYCGTSISMIHKHYAGTIKQVQFHEM